MISAIFALIAHPAAAFLPPPGGGGGVYGAEPTGCLTQPRGWQFEKALGVPVLQNLDPGKGLEFFGWLFVATMAFAAVLSLIMLVVGGVQYIAAAGGAGVGKAKQRISNAVLGLILAMGSILLLVTINPDLVILQLPPLPISPEALQLGQNAAPYCNK